MNLKVENEIQEKFCSYCLSIQNRKFSSILNSNCMVCESAFGFSENVINKSLDENAVKSDIKPMTKFKYESNKKNNKDFYSQLEKVTMPTNFGERSKFAFHRKQCEKSKNGKDKKKYAVKSSPYNFESYESNLKSQKTKFDFIGGDSINTKHPFVQKLNIQSPKRTPRILQRCPPSQQKLFLSSDSGILFNKCSSSEYSIKPVFTTNKRTKELKRIHLNHNFRKKVKRRKSIIQHNDDSTLFKSKLQGRSSSRAKTSQNQQLVPRNDQLNVRESMQTLPTQSRKVVPKYIHNNLQYSNKYITEICLKSIHNGGGINITIEGKELRVANLRNPRLLKSPLPLQKSSYRKLSPGMMAPRNDEASSKLRANYSHRKLEVPQPKPINSKSTVDHLITNMTPLGNMNSMKHSSSNNRISKMDTAVMTGGPFTGSSRIPSSKNYYFRGYQNKYTNSEIPSQTENHLSMNPAQSLQTSQAAMLHSPFINPNFSLNMETSLKQTGKVEEDQHLEEENEAKLVTSNSESEFSFGSVQTNRPIIKWRNSSNFKQRNLQSKDEYNIILQNPSESQSLTQDFKIIAKFGYDVAKSILVFSIILMAVWVCAAILFEVVPFPKHWRYGLYEILSYRKPVPRHSIIIWINRFLRLVGRVTGTSCIK